jgi:hypothetical protein
MDEGPFRASRPADRRVVSRPEPTQRQQEEPQPVRTEPQPVERAPLESRTKNKKKSSRRFKLPLVIAIILVLAIVGWFAWSGMHNKNGTTAIDTSKYQAVFFTNGQVYFGKLSPLNDESMKLTDIYYLQTKSTSATDSNPQQTSTDQSNVQLIKLGSEIHGPEDEMVISKQQVLFYENIKTDGKVAQSIASYQKSH